MQGEGQFWDAIYASDAWGFLTDGECRAIQVILMKVRSRGRLLWQDLDTVAAFSRDTVTKRTLQRALNTLVYFGFAVVHKRSNGRSANTYQIMLDAVKKISPRRKSKTPAKAGAFSVSAATVQTHLPRQPSRTVAAHTSSSLGITNSSSIASNGAAHAPPPPPLSPQTAAAVKRALGWKSTQGQIDGYLRDIGESEFVRLVQQTHRKQGIETDRRRGGYLNTLVKAAKAERTEAANVAPEKKLEQEESMRRRSTRAAAASGPSAARDNVAASTIRTLRPRALQRFRQHLKSLATSATTAKFYETATAEQLAQSPRCRAEVLGPEFLNVNREAT